MNTIQNKVKLSENSTIKIDVLGHTYSLTTKGSTRWYMSCSSGNNANIFGALNIDNANDFVSEIVGTTCNHGSFPEVDNIIQLEIVVNALIELANHINGCNMSLRRGNLSVVNLLSEAASHVFGETKVKHRSTGTESSISIQNKDDQNILSIYTDVIDLNQDLIRKNLSVELIYEVMKMGFTKISELQSDTDSCV